MSATNPAATEDSRRYGQRDYSHKTKVCAHCRQSRSTAQFVDSDFCNTCVRRGNTTRIETTRSKGR